jgi:hypothetical protein
MMNYTRKSDTGVARFPGNLALSAATTGLPKDSVANVSQITTLNLDPVAFLGSFTVHSMDNPAPMSSGHHGVRKRSRHTRGSW